MHEEKHACFKAANTRASVCISLRLLSCFEYLSIGHARLRLRKERGRAVTGFDSRMAQKRALFGGPIVRKRGGWKLGTRTIPLGRAVTLAGVTAGRCYRRKRKKLMLKGLAHVQW